MGFYELQAARDEYRNACDVGGMNRDLLWRYMDVQTRLITPICPHYAEYVWREILKKDGFAVRAGWPSADPPDLTLKAANTYLQNSMALIRDLYKKQVQGSKKGNKKGASVTSPAESNLKCLIYVNEQYEGWQEECLRILQSKFNGRNRTFAPDKEIIEALRDSSVGQAADFRQVQKRCMPFLKFKKDKAIELGPEALDLTLPFGEIEVLQENLGRIKRTVGLEQVEILSMTDRDALAKAGNLASVLNQNPPSPGSPTPIFLII